MLKCIKNLCITYCYPSERRMYRAVSLVNAAYVMSLWAAEGTKLPGKAGLYKIRHVITRPRRGQAAALWHGRLLNL